MSYSSSFLSKLVSLSLVDTFPPPLPHPISPFPSFPHPTFTLSFLSFSSFTTSPPPITLYSTSPTRRTHRRRVFPWHATVIEALSGDAFCQGVRLSTNWVLSRASCFDDEGVARRRRERGKRQGRGGFGGGEAQVVFGNYKKGGMFA